MDQRETLYNQFLVKFPLENLKDMSLEKYTKRKNKENFTYWIEFRNPVAPGNTQSNPYIKYGIYDCTKKDDIGRRRYTWDKKFDKPTASEAYEFVRDAIIKIAYNARNGNYEEIEKDRTLDGIVTRKIAFMYSDLKLIPIFDNATIRDRARVMGMADVDNANYFEIQRFLMNLKGDKELFAYYDEIMAKTEQNKVVPKPTLVNKKTDENQFAFTNVYNEKSTESNLKRRPSYWLYNPGKSASQWSRCLKEGVIVLGCDMQGGDYLGDFMQYKTRDEIYAKLIEMDEYAGRNPTAVRDILWDFAHGIKVGDIIIVKHGRHKIIGRGIVESDYYHDTSAPSYKSCHKVKWTHIVDIDNPRPILLPVKSLLDISIGYQDLKALFEDVPNTPNTEIQREAPRKEIITKSEVQTPEPINMVAEIDEIGNKYTTVNFLKEVYVDVDDMLTLTYLLEHKKNVILQGAPGVGKTFASYRLAYKMLGERNDEYIEFIQFHQNYTYEDFIMGYKPDGNGFKLQEGVFYKFCKRAEADPKHKYFFIIDEINRGNLSKIFGELLMLIENSYRVDKKAGTGRLVKLAYRDESFGIPSNLYLIGMMNTADRSLAMIDYALRRRFSFFEMRPAFDSKGFKDYQRSVGSPMFDHVIEAVKRLNETIKSDPTLGVGFCIGHSYFCDIDKHDDIGTSLRNILTYNVKPMLEEYWFDDPQKCEEQVAKLIDCVR